MYDDVVVVMTTAPLRQVLAFKTIQLTAEKDTVLSEIPELLVDILTSARRQKLRHKPLYMYKQERQSVAVGPGNAHFISVRQVSSDAATLRRGRCEHAAKFPTHPRFYAAAAAAADAAVYRQYDD